jgi:hypothetical protein
VRGPLQYQLTVTRKISLVGSVRSPESVRSESGHQVRLAAKTLAIQQEAGDGHMWDADGEVDMIAGILRQNNIC